MYLYFHLCLYLCISIRHPSPACIYALITSSAKCICLLSFHTTPPESRQQNLMMIMTMAVMMMKRAMLMKKMM